MLVAVAQFGAVRHELGHAIDEVAQSGSTGHTSTTGYHLVCDLCVAFGQVATAIGSTTLAVALAATINACPKLFRVAAVDRIALPARSRGPPSLL